MLEKSFEEIRILVDDLHRLFESENSSLDYDFRDELIENRISRLTDTAKKLQTAWKAEKIC